MGNHRFRLSDMMPNAWFYKLKEMAKTKNHHHHTSSATATTYGLKKKKQNQSSSTSSSSPNSTYPAKLPKQPHHHGHNSSYPRKSYYFTREFIPTSDDPKLFTTSSPIPDPPRKSSKPRTRTNRNRHKVVSSSVSAGCSCRATTLWSNSNIDSRAIECLPDYTASSSDTSPEDSFLPEFRSDRALTTESFDDMLSWSHSSSCNSNNNNDIVIDVDKKSLTTKVDKELQVLDKIPNLDLPPIITKPEKFDDNVDKFVSKKEAKQPTKPNRARPQQRSPGIGLSKRHAVNSPGGVRLRVNSPRIGNRRVQGRKSASAASRKSLSESLAIVKASFDPRRDFRESMVEMIVENNIRASKDLEDLLACYLSLNSDEYHDLIINVFKQIWFDLTDPAKLK